MKQPKNSLRLPKPTRNTRRRGNRLAYKSSSQSAKRESEREARELPGSTIKPETRSDRLLESLKRKQIKLMTVASANINMQIKHNFICHVTKAKPATSAHSMADVIPFFSVFNIRFQSNASIKPKENILYTQ